jgi:hypothetical protein
MEQKLVILKKKKIFEKKSIAAINAEILELNRDGWMITALTPNTDFSGSANTYIALCERVFPKDS